MRDGLVIKRQFHNSPVWRVTLETLFKHVIVRMKYDRRAEIRPGLLRARWIIPASVEHRLAPLRHLALHTLLRKLYFKCRGSKPNTGFWILMFSTYILCVSYRRVSVYCLCARIGPTEEYGGCHGSRFCIQTTDVDETRTLDLMIQISF